MADPLYIDSSGAVVPVPADQLDGAAQLGWVPASPKQASDFALQQKYGTTPEAVKAFGEHAASALTLGLSDVAERHLGVDPAAMRAREAANPIASGAGTAAGVVAGLALPGLGEASGPALVAKVGKGAATAVRGSLPAGLLAKAAAAGAGSAVEGAAYGLGQVVHEAALGDPNLTAQSALATVGLSAALGGALGGAGGVLGHVVGSFGPSDFGGKVSEMLQNAEGHSNLNATNARPGDIRKVFTAKGEESATRIGLEARDLGIIRSPLLDSPGAIAERATAVKAEQGQAISSLLAEAAPRVEATSFDAIRGDVEGPILKALKRRGATVAIGDQFEGVMDRYAQAYAGRPLTLDGVWELKNDIGDFIYKQGKVIDPWAKELNTPLKRVYDHLDSMIEGGLSEASGPDAVKAWNTGNRNFEVAATMERLAKKGIERSAENNSVHLTGQVGAMAGLVAGGPTAAAALGVASEAVRRRGASFLGWGARALRDALEPATADVVNQTADAISASRAMGVVTDISAASSAPEKVATLSLLERLNQQAQRKIETGISTLVRGGPRAANIGRGEISAGVASVFGHSAEDAQAGFTKRTEHIRGLANDPALLQDKLTQQTDDWHEHAPNTAQALQVTTARAVSFLASKLPQNGKPGPLARTPVPSRAEISKFNRYYEAVQNPHSILKQAAAGTLTPEAVEAVQTVYPDLFNAIRAEAVAKMAGAKSVPYRSRLMLSMLLGQDTDGTTLPFALMRNRAIFAKPLAAPQMPKATPARADKLTMATRMNTPTQANRSRQ